jgi:GTP 3',8-cyclase
MRKYLAFLILSFFFTQVFGAEVTAKIEGTSLFVERGIDRAFRLKVTNNCPFSCTFCHNEGTELPERGAVSRVSTLLDERAGLPPVEDVKLRDIEDLGSGGFSVGDLKVLQEIGFDSIHLTGGEPTMHRRLEGLIRIFVSQGFKVKMTSNGQFRKPLLKRYKDAGLGGVTFSILSFDSKEFLETQGTEFATDEAALLYSKKTMNKLRGSIEEAIAVGLRVKANVVVLGDDFERVKAIVNYCVAVNAEVNLLPLLDEKHEFVDDHKMEEEAFSCALRLGAVYEKTIQFKNNSKGTHYFRMPDGQKLGVKFLYKYQPKVFCEDCEHFYKPSCMENFYGVRLEFRGGKPYVRLCVQKSDPRRLMSLDEFAAHEVLIRALGLSEPFSADAALA